MKQADLDRVRAYLGKHPTATVRVVSAALQLRTSSVCDALRLVRESSPKPSAFDPADHFDDLIKLIRGGPRTVRELANALDLSPLRVESMISAANAAGYDVHASADVIGRKPAIDTPVEIAQPTSGWQLIGVISDLHAGSKYCMRAQLRDFVLDAYSLGVREILCPGDMLDGCYRHGRWELTHHGIDAQCDDLFELLPHCDGLSYHAIEGNHDDTFRDGSGLDVSRYIMARAQAAGRDDLHVYGGREATLRVRGATINLWHPGGGISYAKSYRAQRYVQSNYGPHKPDIVLIGHFHQFNHCDERGVQAICCPTFQGAGSRFSKMLGGSTALGGLLLAWRLTDTGTLRDFNLTRRAYFENEAPSIVHTQNTPIGEPIERQAWEQSAVRR
jgi:predicted phosphodiesterase